MRLFKGRAEAALHRTRRCPKCRRHRRVGFGRNHGGLRPGSAEAAARRLYRSPILSLEPARQCARGNPRGAEDNAQDSSTKQIAETLSKAGQDLPCQIPSQHIGFRIHPRRPATARSRRDGRVSAPHARTLQTCHLPCTELDPQRLPVLDPKSAGAGVARRHASGSTPGPARLTGGQGIGGVYAGCRGAISGCKRGRQLRVASATAPELAGRAAAGEVARPHISCRAEPTPFERRVR